MCIRDRHWLYSQPVMTKRQIIYPGFKFMYLSIGLYLILSQIKPICDWYQDAQFLRPNFLTAVRNLKRESTDVHFVELLKIGLLSLYLNKIACNLTPCIDLWPLHINFFVDPKTYIHAVYLYILVAVYLYLYIHVDPYMLHLSLIHI